MSSYAKKQFISTLIIISAFMIAPILALATSGVINDPAQPDSAMPTIGENTPPSIAEGDVAKLIRYIYLFGLAAAGLAAMGALIYGGVLYLTAGGSQGQVTKGKKRIYGALYGVGLILVSFIILYTINPALVSFTNPATDPLKQYSSDFWNIAEYGKAHANAPKDVPCYDSKDCAYDLSCCSSGQAACEQQFSYLDNNLMLSILGVSTAAAATQQWFKCGFEDYQWVEQNSCPNDYQPAQECTSGSTTNCCSLDNKPYDKTVVCCAAPRLVAAPNKDDCNKIYGSDQSYTTGQGADKKTFLGHGWCPNGCGQPLKTCQPIQPSGDSIFDYNLKKHETTDRLQETCFRSKDYFSSAKDSCLDERLICNQFFGQCRAPGKTGDPCKDKYDCCQGEAGFWKKLWGVTMPGVTMPDVDAYENNPNCQIYKAYGISLDCKEGVCTPPGQFQENGTNIQEGSYECTTINKKDANNNDNQCGQANDGRFANDATGYPVLDTTFKLGSGCQLADRNLSLCCCKQITTPTPSATQNGWRELLRVNQKDRQISETDPDMINLLNCVYDTKKGGYTINSLSHDNPGFTECTNSYTASCEHGQFSCHFGGQNHCSKSVAVDIGGPDYNEFEQKACQCAKNMGLTLQKNNEIGSANHMHYSIKGDVCGCDTQLPVVSC